MPEGVTGGREDAGDSTTGAIGEGRSGIVTDGFLIGGRSMADDLSGGRSFPEGWPSVSLFRAGGGIVGSLLWVDIAEGGGALETWLTIGAGSFGRVLAIGSIVGGLTSARRAGGALL